MRGPCRKTIFLAKMKSPNPLQAAGERVSCLVCYLWPCDNNFMSGLVYLHETTFPAIYYFIAVFPKQVLLSVMAQPLFGTI